MSRDPPNMVAYTSCRPLLHIRLSVGGANVGTCVYKTANIKGHALDVA